MFIVKERRRILNHRKVYKDLLTYYLRMMKSISEKFEEEEFKNLKDMKGKISWHDFIMIMYNHCLESEKKGLDLFNKK